MKTIFCLTVGALVTLGCTAQTPLQRAKLDRVDCYVKALGPIALGDAEAVAKDLVDGNVSLEDVFQITGMGEQTVKDVKAAVKACNDAHPLPAPASPPGDAGIVG